jgi:hypothetical protein
MVDELVNLYITGETSTPRCGFDGAEDQVLPLNGSVIAEAVKQPLDFSSCAISMSQTTQRRHVFRSMTRPTEST